MYYFMINDQALTKSAIVDLFKTEMGKFKKEMRANSLAVPKTQGAAGGKPGQKSRKRPRDLSGNSPAGSSKKKQKKESQKKRKKKKNQQQQQQQQQQLQRQKQRSNKLAVELVENEMCTIVVGWPLEKSSLHALVADTSELK
jgi:transcription initiation factor TFIID subunit TAF12